MRSISVVARAALLATIVCLPLAADDSPVLLAPITEVPLEPDPPDPLDLLLESKLAVVRIESRTSGAIQRGSGVIVSETGCVMTARHVISGSNDIVIRTACGQSLRPYAVCHDPEVDVALLPVKFPKPVLPARVSPEDDPEVGTDVTVAGNKYGRGVRIVEGTIGDRRLVRYSNYSGQLVSVNAPIDHGDSGGGVFDETSGELIGIVVAKSSTTARTGYVVDSRRLLMNMARFTPSDRMQDSFRLFDVFGICVQEVEVNDDRHKRGLEVTWVEPGMAADRAGITVSDVLVGLGRHRTTTVSDALFTVEERKESRTEPLLVKREEGFVTRRIRVDPDSPKVARDLLEEADIELSDAQFLKLIRFLPDRPLPEERASAVRRSSRRLPYRGRGFVRFIIR
jgi:S1-C subfamily serine protease